MFADKANAENRPASGSPGANYWPYHDCFFNTRWAEQWLSPDKRVEQKAISVCQKQKVPVRTAQHVTALSTAVGLF